MFKVKNLKVEGINNPLDFELPATGVVAITKGKNQLNSVSSNSIYAILKFLSTMDLNYQGEILFNEKELKEFNEAELDNYRNHIAYLPVLNHFLGTTIKTAFIEASIDDENQIKNALAKVGLNEDVNVKISDLDSLKKQLLSLAIAIARSPKILFWERCAMFDGEGPTSFETNYRDFFEALKRIASDCLIVVGVTYNVTISNIIYIKINKEGIISGDEVIPSKQDSSSNEFIETESLKNKKNSFKELMNFGFKYGCIRKNILGFVFLILSFVFLGIASTYLFYDSTYTISSLFNSNELKKLQVYKSFNYKFEDYTIDKYGVKSGIYRGKISDNGIKYEATEYTYSSHGAYSIDEINALNNNSVGHRFIGVRDTAVALTSTNLSSNLYYVNKLDDICEADSEFFTHYNIPLVAGEYPKNYDSVAVSTYIASGILFDLGLKDDDYNSLVGKSVEFSWSTIKKNLTISGIYDFGMPDAKYNYLKNATWDPGNMPDEKYASLTKDWFDFFIELRALQGLLSLYTKKGFLKENSLSYRTIIDNFHMKDYSEYSSNYSCSDNILKKGYDYRGDSFIPFEEAVNSKDYTFFDLEENKITSPTLGDNECYLPYLIYDSTNIDLFEDEWQSRYYGISQTPFTVKGYYLGPTSYCNLIMNTSSVEKLGVQIINDYYYQAFTDYKPIEDGCYDYALAYSHYSINELRSIQRMPQNGFHYSIDTRAESIVPYTTQYPWIILGIGIVLLAIATMVIVSMFRNANKDYMEWKNKFVYLPNIIASNVVYTIIFIVGAFLISLIGIYSCCGIINAIETDKYKIIQFNGFGYLMMIGIVIILSGAVALNLFRLKKKSK